MVPQNGVFDSLRRAGKGRYNGCFPLIVCPEAE